MRFWSVSRVHLGIALLSSGLLGCAKGQSEADAAALASAKEAQIRAESELKAMKALAAVQPQPAPAPAPSPVEPAAAVPVSNGGPNAALGPAESASSASGGAPGSASCGCKTPACSCVNVSVSVVPAARKPGNLAWDGLGGAPDPQVTLRAPAFTKTSPVFQDQLSITTTFANVPLTPGDPVAIDVFDADVATSDPMGTLTTSYSAPGSTKSGTLTAATVTVRFSK